MSYLTARHLTVMFYLSTCIAISVCELEEIFLELYTCLLMFKVLTAVARESLPTMVYQN